MGEKPILKTLTDVREHVLYCGVTQTGKTTLARHHARILDAADYDVHVYDPVGTETLGGDWPERAKVLTTPEQFHKHLEHLEGTADRPVFMFVDESADLFGHAETHAHWIPRSCRHSHIYLRLIVQRPKMLHPSVRTQCAYAFMLRLSQDDGKQLAGDFGHSADTASIPLDKGDAILLTSGTAAIDEFNVFELVDRRRPSQPME